MERELFLEIGLEELPASWMPGLNLQIAEKIKTRLAGMNLKQAGSVESFSTPRRLAVVVPSLADRQDDRDEKLMGPPVSAGLGPDGQPTQALLGFARKNNVEISALTQEDTPKGRYYAYTKQHRGRATVDVLPELLGGLLRDLAFPKMMHWDAQLEDGKGELLFGRPIRWLLFLYGGRVVPFTISRMAGASSPRVQDVVTGANTYGHRFLATSGRAGRAIKVRSFDEYRKKLAEQFVIIARTDRRDRIRRELDGAARKMNGHVLIKGQPQAEALLDEVPDLIEYPSVVAGAFGAEFLQLPEEVLTTTLIHHQHYFPVAGPQGKLLPAFLAVTNTQPGNDRGIAVNAERVVTARLRDARFFWDTDRTVGLEARLARLDTVLFHKALGSYGDKAKRIEALARWIATDVFGQDAALADHAARAAKLCKADLATDMVGEFPELQGVMGGVYAQAAGEPEEVWKAIYHHYAPIGVEADAPPSLEALGKGKVTWACVSLADKIDTLVGLFKAGEKPTGSRDPFGMRRAAQGVVKVLADSSALGLPACNVIDLFNKALAQFSFIADEGTPQAFVDAFMKERVSHLLERRGISADASRAVSGKWFQPAECVRQAEALEAQLKNSKGELLALAELYKRIANITKGVDGLPTVNSALLKEDAEVALNEAFNAVAAQAEAAWKSGGGFPAAIRLYLTLRPAVDRFFADVMVMVDDEALRAARLALLTRLRHAISTNIGDLTQLGAGT
jgi:glycyl-tRNA synthetase beta chain